MIIIFSDTCLSYFQALLKDLDPQRYTLFFLLTQTHSVSLFFLGVIATKNFAKAEVVADYHGNIISRAEGEKKLKDEKEGMSYCYFFKGFGDITYCLDASEPCPCHPDKDTYGRRFNHSRKKPNLKAERVTFKGPNGPKEILLFKALRDILVGEELFFDYNVRRGQYNEAYECDWLDS